MYEGHFTKKNKQPNNNKKKTKGREVSCRASSSSSAVESELHRSTLATEVTLNNGAVSTDEAWSTPEKHTRSTCRLIKIWQDNFGGRLEGLLVQMQCRWGFQCTSYQEKALQKTLDGLEELFVSWPGDNLGSPENGKDARWPLCCGGKICVSTWSSVVRDFVPLVETPKENRF